MNVGTKPYSETEGVADPGMYNYETDPPKKPRMRIIPGKNKNDIILLNTIASVEQHTETPNIIHTDLTEGMSNLYPSKYDYEPMDTTASFYVGALSVVGLFVLFRVLYSR
jgi:hypothetical protein